MTEPFDAALRHFSPGLPLAVGLSGGADSTALLLACAARWPGRIHAFHVHHGLQAAADDFEAHCVALCRRLDVPLAVQRVDARHAQGRSPEDAARQARYRALERLARQADTAAAFENIALAQHADDQVETLLLALSRGAGVAGLAAMPARWQRGGITWHRPLLGVAGADIRAWLQACGGCWVEDPSNADERYTRNSIRRHLLPVLQQVLPQFRTTFARSSSHCAEVAALLQDIAVADLTVVGCPPQIALVQSLGNARQANVLRHWLRSRHGTTPSAAQMAQLLVQIAACRTRGHNIHIKVGSGFVRRNGVTLNWCAAV